MRAIDLPGGVIIHGDVLDPDVVSFARSAVGAAPLIVADPPFGRIVSLHWDRVRDDAATFAMWMKAWTRAWADALVDGGAFYVWGGTGKVGFRPLYTYAASVEAECRPLQIANHITWKKRRGYGVRYNYLYTREELLYMVKGEAKKPRRFSVPYTEEKRGYAGYNPKYPAKSEYKRLTNVWEITEVMRGKLHECQKADRVCEIPIEVHTEPGEVVIDLFGGCGSVSAAAQRMGRRFVMVEADAAEVEKSAIRLSSKSPASTKPKKRAA